MALTHNSTLSDKEPSWGSVDKTKLPRNAHADMGEMNKKSTWRYPHHHVVNGKVGGKNEVYVSGTMYLHKGGLRAALQAAGGARSGKKESDPKVKSHLSRHADAIGMSKKETAAYLGISVDALKELMTVNTNKNENNKGGEARMEPTYDELKATINDLEATNEGLKSEAEKLNETIATLQETHDQMVTERDSALTEIDTLKAEMSNKERYVAIGQAVIADLKADIKKMSAQVDGDDYKEELIDKQIEAFGDDYESLKSFSEVLTNRRKKMFKSGELDPDEANDDIVTKKQKQYELGKKVAQAKIIPMNK